MNLITLIWYKQSLKDDSDESSRVQLTPREAVITQRVLGVIILIHGVIIFVFDSYKKSSFIMGVFNAKGIVKAVKYLFSEHMELVYYLFYVGLAIVGLYNSIWFTFHLNDILNINQVLKNVLMSVWKPRLSIALTLILFLVVLYAFSAVGFVYFSVQYANSMPDGVPCRSIFECFVLTLDKGFKFDGGIGNYLADNNENKIEDKSIFVPIDLGRFFFENLLLLIDLIIILNIVSGIIIDTFGSLREDYNKYIEDTETYCFICGMDRETIDKESESKDGFDHHVKGEHDQWAYLFYMAHLRDKKETDYTGIESHVAELLKNEDIRWFPNHRAIIFKEDNVIDPKEAIENDLKEMVENVGLFDTA